VSDRPNEPLDDQFGWRSHDKGWPEHSGKRGHYCLEFDGLWICEDCGEFTVCRCFEEPSK
jgi:hypothetical protein